MEVIESFDLASKVPETISSIAVKQEPFQVPSPERYQDVVSEMVAKRLLNVFAISTIGIICIVAMIAYQAAVKGYSPQDAGGLTEKAVVPFLRETAFFAETVFGPLLAFILGFYFGKEK